MRYTFFVSIPQEVEVEASSEEEAIQEIYRRLGKTEYDYVEIRKVVEVDSSR